MKRGFLFLFLWHTVLASQLSELTEAIRDNHAPALLSQTGVFRDLRSLSPRDELLPYDLNAAFWSDGAVKQRWIFLPEKSSVRFSPTNEWKFPAGTMFVKQFSIATNSSAPSALRRLETRFTVVNPTGGIVGVTYRWRADESDAELLGTNATELLSFHNRGGTRSQLWNFPSRSDCLTCHTPLNGGVLGVNTRQMNRSFTYPGGNTENQIAHWAKRGLFDGSPNFLSSPKLVPAEESAVSLERRARSWLDANCAHCHRPGGTVANFDARFDTPLAQQNLIDATVLIDEGIDGARLIAPKDIWRSILFLRVNTTEAFKMPPLAHETVDQKGTELLREWIQSMPGPDVLQPPTISPPSGDFTTAVRVTLSHRDTNATIHFSLDGSAPGKSSPIYSKAILLTEPATVRARAFRDGFKKSITVQETFVPSAVAR